MIRRENVPVRLQAGETCKILVAFPPPAVYDMRVSFICTRNLTGGVDDGVLSSVGLRCAFLFLIVSAE